MEDTKTADQVAAEDTASKKFNDPYQFLSEFPNAPSKAMIDSWKQQAPNGRVRLFTPDAKRVYLVRGVGGLELDKLQGQIPTNLGANLPAEQQQAKVERELQLLVAAQCCVWTSVSGNGKLDAELLRIGSAGLPATLFNLISYLSDFVDPEAFNVLSIDL